MARLRKQFKAEWYDDDGRHRQWFRTADEAREQETKMQAAQMARRLGRVIARGARKGPKRQRTISGMLNQSLKIALVAAKTFDLTTAQLSA